MIKKIKSLLKEYREDIEAQKTRIFQLEDHLKELDWANVYHDSIRGKPWLENLSHSPGRWAASYPLLYILVRILNDCQPATIIEFGLGETSKIISLFLQHKLRESKHVILENNEEWKKQFENIFPLNERSTIKLLPLEQKGKGNHSYNGYKGIETIEGIFDLYLIDGPLGSRNFSRFDIYTLAKRLKMGNEFILLLDDYNRPGEQETYKELVRLFYENGISVSITEYTGKKSIAVFVTAKYKWVGSL